MPQIPPSPSLPLQETVVVVEYPKRLSHLIPERLGPLDKLRDRR